MENPSSMSSTFQGMKQGSDIFLAHTVVKYPGTTVIIMAVLIVLVFILIITTVVYRNKWAACNHKSSFYATNLSTGGNNPQWWLGSHDAGYGGSMHTAQNTSSGDTRAYGASTGGMHSMGKWLHPGSGACSLTSPQAMAEVQAGQALQSIDPEMLNNSNMGNYSEMPSINKNSARHMNDDQLFNQLGM
jgi:hypothetical protein